MFNSIVESAEFQNKYKKYMNVQEDRIYSNLIESLEVTGDDIYRTISVLEDCVKLMEVNSETLTEAGAAETMKKIQPFLDDPTKLMGGYKAATVDIEKTVKWNEEKGIVGKIVAFIRGIIKWLWSLIKTVFSGIRNFIVRVLGGETPEKTKKKVMKLSDALQRISKSSLETVELIDKDAKKNSIVSVYKLGSDSDIMGITEALDYLSEDDGTTVKPDDEPDKGKGDKGKDDNKGKGNDRGGRDDRRHGNHYPNNNMYSVRRANSPTMVVFDLKNEIYSLKQLVDHFLSIYDTAYGSNNENLFGVDDLDLLLSLFVNTLNDLKAGNVRAYETRAGYVEVKPIDASAVRDNLFRTNANLTQLKDVFAQTHAGIQSIARLLNAKQMQALSASPQVYKFLSMETYGQMKDILDVLEPRLKDARKMEKELNLAKQRFEAVAAELERLTPALSALGNLTYVPEHQKRVLNLLNSSKYMVQTVQLRIGAISLYLRDLEEIKSLLVALSAGGKEFASEFRLAF